MNLESIYIVGDFLFKDNALHPLKTLSTGNLTEQGCPYYSGRIAYTTDVIAENHAKARLHFGKFHGVTATVSINGETIRTIGWGLNETDLTGKVKPGKNTVTVEITNSLQNMLGPFGSHASQHLVHPGSFYTDKHEVFAPVGFDGAAELRMV
jgi:hypothetical protein